MGYKTKIEVKAAASGNSNITDEDISFSPIIEEEEKNSSARINMCAFVCTHTPFAYR